MSTRHKRPMPLFEAAIEVRAETFHAENPHVFGKLQELALQAKRAGVKKLGIAALFERLRWFAHVETQGDKYALNNSYRAFYARKLMQESPELEGFFEIRSATFDPQYHERPTRGAA